MSADVGLAPWVVARQAGAVSTVLDLRSPWPRPIAPGTQLARFEGATRVFIGGISAASFGLPVVFNNAGEWSPRTLIFWVFLAVGLALYVFPEHPRFGVLLVLAVCCYSPHSDFNAGSNWYTWSLSVGLLVLGTEFKTTATMWLYSGYLVALIASTYWAFGGPAAHHLIDLAPLHLALAYVISRCLIMFLSGIDRLDAERSGRTVTVIAQDLALHEVNATREAQRILHDRVLTTLTRVADLGSVDRESLRRTVHELSNPLGVTLAPEASDEVPLDVVIQRAVESSGSPCSSRCPPMLTSGPGWGPTRR